MKNLLKKSAKVLVLVGAVTTLAINTSSAYFTDTATSIDNVVTTGELDILLTDNDEFREEEVEFSLNATKLMPITDDNPANGDIISTLPPNPGEAIALNQVHKGQWLKVYNPNDMPIGVELTLTRVIDVDDFAVGRGDDTDNLATWIHTRVSDTGYVQDGNTELDYGRLYDGTNYLTFGYTSSSAANYEIPAKSTKTYFFEFALENDPDNPQGQSESVEFDITATGRSL